MVIQDNFGIQLQKWISHSSLKLQICIIPFWNQEVKWKFLKWVTGPSGPKWNILAKMDQKGPTRKNSHGYELSSTSFNLSLSRRTLYRDCFTYSEEWCLTCNGQPENNDMDIWIDSWRSEKCKGVKVYENTKRHKLMLIHHGWTVWCGGKLDAWVGEQWGGMALGQQVRK